MQVHLPQSARNRKISAAHAQKPKAKQQFFSLKVISRQLMWMRDVGGGQQTR